MVHMSRARVTITLSRELLSRVDKAARATPGASRSSIVESWLKRAAREDAQQALDRSIADYYDGLEPAEAVDAAEWARFATRAFVARESRAPYATRARRQKKGSA